MSSIPQNPWIRIRGGRLVQAGRLTGPLLEAGLAGIAARLGMTLDELHECITVYYLMRKQAGPCPGFPENFDEVMTTIHRQRFAH